MVQNLQRTVIFVFLALFFSLLPLGAQSFFSGLQWSFNGSMQYFASNNGVQGADVGTFTPSVGASAAWNFWRFLSLEITEDFYFKNYEYNSTLEYAMACGQENRSALVFGFVTGAQLTAAVPFGSSGLRMRIFAGPVMDIRIVMLAWGLKHPADFTGKIETDARMQTDAIRKYFWSNGRWFLPVAGIGLDFPANEKFLVGLDLRCWFPLYRIS
ncbi:MAG: hypothetical protein LBI12_01920, partial [Treponema sp.]|nr:hypothetical protein [Treponema sp.]